MKLSNHNGPANFPKMEEDILQFWKEKQIFERSLEQTSKNEEFVFYDGPPFATGLPHYGHLLAGTIKDVIPRYQTMRGKYVKRTFGWDCHGLPVEYEQEKTLGLSGKKSIEDFGIGQFNEACRSVVLRYTAEWERVVTRMGRWVDFKNGYKTMDRSYMESIWWVFKQLWEKGLIYEGYKILPYCPRCSTPLSNFEANQGYKDVDDPAITIRFKSKTIDGAYYLAWTTTPWTLSSNMGLAVGSDIDYVLIQEPDAQHIMAADRVAVYYKNETPHILKTFKGADLAGHQYEPLFPYFDSKSKEGAFRVICADFVSTSDGTGIVHLAPGFGEDDAAAGKANGLPEVCPIDEECRYTSEIFDMVGMYVKDADKEVIKRLKDEGKLVHRGVIKHSYPHCWRDDSPLIYRAVSTWFVKIDEVKEKMLNANAQINWVPEHIKEGRFGKWLENARDWAISRNRYWGCPLPVWRNFQTGEILCIGSGEELEKLIGRAVPDIHKHFVDDIKIPSKKFPGTFLERVTEVLDCWFESGSMPYAQQHYPFENRQRFESTFPADFIAEGLDQTRGWFYTLVVLGAALFDKPAFKNVIVNGLILAEDGQKMSKSKRNYPDPSLIFDQYGADAMRLYLLSSQVVRGEDLKFSEKEGVRETLRSVILPLWNAYSFFCTYADVDKWEPPEVACAPENPQNPLDRWILSSLAEMVEEITEHMDHYQLQKAATRFTKFVEDLTNWYIRRSRRRFWKSQNDGDKWQAYQTLHYALITFAKTAAPFIPFVTETIYTHLRTDAMPESVHLCDFPTPETQYRDRDLELQMESTQLSVKLGRFLRAKNELKTRQPLAQAIVVTRDEKVRALLHETEALIAEELNVKKVVISDDESQLVSYSCKADFKVLGKKMGKEMKTLASKIAAFEPKTIVDLLNGKSVTLSLTEGEYTLQQEDVVIIRDEKVGVCVATEEGITVALETTLNEALLEEGVARELVSVIQAMRKSANLQVSDRISVEIYTKSRRMKSALVAFNSYVSSETLAEKLMHFDEDSILDLIEVNEQKCAIKIDKI